MFGLTKSTFERVVLYIIISIIVVVVVFPLYWLIITSFKYDIDSYVYPPQFFPRNITFKNYFDILFLAQEGNLIKYFFNSLVITLSTIFLSLLFGSMAAYSLSKHYLAMMIRRTILALVLIIRIFPPITTAIPYYIILSRLGLVDTHIGVVISYVAFSLPFTIWLMIGFFQGLPQEIEKAAIIDGCNFIQRFIKIIFPLSLPGLAVTAIFCFLYSWNEFMLASILTSENAKTLPVVMAGFISDKYLFWGRMSALGVLMTIPVIIFSSLAQKHIVKGLTFGAVKE
jgi:multiple sugar transport system permease protein